MMRILDINMRALVCSAVIAVLCSYVPCAAQPGGAFDVLLSGGGAAQFATMVNTGVEFGPDVNVMAAWQVRPNRGLRMWIGYENFRAPVDEVNIKEVRAWYISAGIRTDLYSWQSGVHSFLLLGFGAGNCEPSVVTNSTASIRNTAIQLGVGIPVPITPSLKFVTMLRFVVGANSGFTIPVTAGLQWNP
jgi:hypothetical protein